MRILHVIPHYYPAIRYGGPIRSVHGLAAATAALGHEVHVYTTNIDGSGSSDVITNTANERDGVAVWYFSAGLGRKVFRSPDMDRKIWETIDRFDIVHIHYVWVWPTVTAAAAARRYDVPYLLSPRGMLVPDLVRRKSWLAKQIWLLLFDARNVEAAAAIHVTSEREGIELCALGLRPDHIEIVPNGVDIPPKSEIKAWNISQSGDCPYVLYLGRINWKKGLDRLIASMALVKNVNLVIAGYDENGYQAKVMRLAAEAGLGERTRFVGPVEGKAKWELVRNAACLVLPSYNENFGMAVIEAMAVGCPVVVTEEVGLANVVRDSGSGLVASSDTRGLAEAIETVVRSPERQKMMGEAGTRTVRERFEWSSIARQMEAVYLQVLNNASKPSRTR